ncbi:MAG TPA: MBL fold metallo-hydrolase [Burkholderiales bacterium]|nr:MBL fold metallo-hydrolase [Burkholderiales bacterium]
MLIRFWGTRGSLPVALTWRDLRDRLARVLVAANGRGLDTVEKAQAFAEQQLGFPLRHTFGGHTSCVELEPPDAEPDEYFVCDMGSGARPFGEHVAARQAGRPATINVFMSHMHWDHIMGFPFFGPAYTHGNRIRIHGCHEALEHAFRRQQEPPSFPVPFSQLSAEVEFVHLAPGQVHRFPAFTVTPQPQHHSGDSYGFRFESHGKSVVYTTDSEHKLDDHGARQKIVEFFYQADLVIFDAMYSLADAVSVKADWGHSSNVVGVELCQAARVRKLALFHHEPANDDDAIERILRETRRLEELTREEQRLEVIAAYDGLEIEL